MIVHGAAGGEGGGCYKRANEQEEESNYVEVQFMVSSFVVKQPENGVLFQL